MEARVVVTVSEMFADLLGPYLERRRAELAEWRVWLDEGDFEQVRRASHRVRGSGGSYGIAPLSALAERVERSAMAEDGKDCRHAIDEIEALLNNLDLRFE